MNSMPRSIGQRLEILELSIVDALNNANRERTSLQVIAVSKRQPIESIRAAYTAGQLHFGENYWKEMQEKISRLDDLNICWHFIGGIQSNKASEIAKQVHWVHSVDRVKIAKILNDQRPSNLSPLNICIQINLHEEAQKYGLHKSELLPLIEEIKDLNNINIRGLMSIPAIGCNALEQESTFQQMQQLLVEAKNTFPTLTLDTLSMGMSSDWQTAVHCGSTMIRLGTSIFGPRN